jgi:hypothetical protein
MANGSASNARNLTGRTDRQLRSSVPRSATRSTDRYALPTTSPFAAAPPGAAGGLEASADDPAGPWRLGEQAVHDAGKLARALGDTDGRGSHQTVATRAIA